MYQSALDPYRIQYEDAARKMAEDLLAAASKAGAWSEWQSKTLELLNSKYPKEFPAEKVEASFTSDPHVELRTGPLDIDVGGPEPEQPEQPETPDAGTPESSTPEQPGTEAATPPAEQPAPEPAAPEGGE